MARKRKVTASDLTQASAEQLMDDLQTVLEDAEALLSATTGQAGERIQQVRTRAEETVRAVRDRLAAAQDEVTRRARAALDDADEYVRENPWQALGVTAGVAFLIGLLAGRLRRHPYRPASKKLEGPVVRKY
jgi:ElaB/YqjD/DUF883 family membrane-anchored ribosome-binding protein